MQDTTIRNGALFTRINAGNYDVRQANGDNFVDECGDEYWIHVRDLGDGSWGTTLIYDDDNIPEDLPDYVQIAQEIEAEFTTWEKIEVLKDQIENWDCEDVGALRGRQNEKTGGLKMTSLTLNLETVLNMVIQNEDDLYPGNAGKIIEKEGNVSYMYPSPETEFPGSIVIDPSDLVDLNRMEKDGHGLDIEGYRDDARTLAATGDIEEVEAEEISISDWKAWAEDYLKSSIETEAGTFEIKWMKEKGA